jgi:3-hydroxybutyryl-CoA dehydrogenase
MSIQTVGVIGAGQMGNGIAHTFAVAGYRVLLNDISEDALTAAMARIEKNTARQVSKGTLGEDARTEALANIRTTQDLGELGGTDLVIEAATEREDIKNQIFAGLAPSLGENTILTTNTSSLSITRLAAKTDRPERFMGFHFMNPVPVMQLVELIRGIATSDETYQTLLDVVKRLGKTAASAEDYPRREPTWHPTLSRSNQLKSLSPNREPVSHASKRSGNEPLYKILRGSPNALRLCGSQCRNLAATRPGKDLDRPPAPA